jgi:hypothetical protein
MVKDSFVRRKIIPVGFQISLLLIKLLHYLLCIIRSPQNSCQLSFQLTLLPSAGVSSSRLLGQLLWQMEFMKGGGKLPHRLRHWIRVSRDSLTAKSLGSETFKFCIKKSEKNISLFHPLEDESINSIICYKICAIISLI